jgi:hypothetical protein
LSTPAVGVLWGILIFYIYSYEILFGALLGALVGASGLLLPCLALVQAWLLLVPLLCLASTADTVLRPLL